MLLNVLLKNKLITMDDVNEVDKIIRKEAKEMSREIYDTFMPKLIHIKKTKGGE